MQETLLQAWKELRHLRDADSFGAWFRRIARNTMINLAIRGERKKKVTFFRPLPKGFEGKKAHPPDEVERREIEQIICDEIDQLDQPHREVFVLCKVDDKTRKEAASLLGIPAGTVASRLQRGIQALRDSLALRLPPDIVADLLHLEE